MFPNLPVDRISQQDGAQPRYIVAVRHLRKEKLLGSWIVKGCILPWPARYLDLNLFDVFI